MAKRAHHHHKRTSGVILGLVHQRQTRVAIAVLGVILVVGGFLWNWQQTAPRIMITSNNLGAISGGTKMIITGSGFKRSGTTKVYFGDKLAANIEVAATTTIVAVSPAGSAGAVTVTVVNPDGRRASQAQAFTYSSIKPVITAITPATGPVTGGTLVTIKGHGFLASAVSVRIKTTSVSAAVQDDATLTFVTPAQSTPNQVNVLVATPGDTYTSDNVNFLYR